jgi:hypothetical protein
MTQREGILILLHCGCIRIQVAPRCSFPRPSRTIAADHIVMLRGDEPHRRASFLLAPGSKARAHVLLFSYLRRYPSGAEQRAKIQRAAQQHIISDGLDVSPFVVLSAPWFLFFFISNFTFQALRTPLPARGSRTRDTEKTSETRLGEGGGRGGGQGNRRNEKQRRREKYTPPIHPSTNNPHQPTHHPSNAHSMREHRESAVDTDKRTAASGAARKDEGKKARPAIC